MSKETIGVDIDDVLSKTVPSFLKFSNQQFGTSLSVEDYDEDLPRMWQVDHDTFLERVKEFDNSNIVREYEHFEEAFDVLQSLKSDYKLVVVTSRRKSFIEQTTEWLQTYFPDTFEEVHHAGIYDELPPGMEVHKFTKAEICREVGADYLIDDQEKHCLAVAQAGIRALLFGDYPWRPVGQLPDSIKHVKDWNEVAEYFNV